MLERQREAVAEACRALAEAGLVAGASGNVSVREGDAIAVTATGAELGRITAAGVAVIGLDGTVLEGPAPTSELLVHLGIYARWDALAVVHAHAPAAIAASRVLAEVPCEDEAAGLGGAVRVSPPRPEGSAALAEAVLTALEDRTAAIMGGHGTVAYGPDLATALRRTAALELACARAARAAPAA